MPIRPNEFCEVTRKISGNFELTVEVKRHISEFGRITRFAVVKAGELRVE